MTDANVIPNAGDTVDDDDAGRRILDKEGDRWAGNRAFARDEGLRRALRNDIDAGRGWAGDRAALARRRIEEEPLKASLYALGLGVVIGILLRR